MTTEKKSTQPFKIILNANGKEFKSEGETMLEAIKTMTHPLFVKTKAILEVKRGKLQAQRIMKPFELNKLKTNKVYQIIFAKNLEIFLK